MHARRTIGRMTSTNAVSRWTLSSVGNRVLYATVVAFALWFLLQSAVVPIAAGLIAFAILTGIAYYRG